MAGQGGERPLPPGPEPPGLSAPLDAPDLPDTGGRGRGFWYGLVPLWGEAVGLGNGGGDAAGPEAAGRGKAFGPQAAGEPGLPVGAFLPGLGGLVPLSPAPRGLGVAVRGGHQAPSPGPCSPGERGGSRWSTSSGLRRASSPWGSSGSGRPWGCTAFWSSPFWPTCWPTGGGGGERELAGGQGGGSPGSLARAGGAGHPAGAPRPGSGAARGRG